MMASGITAGSTRTVSAAEHPNALDTVTEYCPTMLTVMEDSVLPLLHK